MRHSTNNHNRGRAIRAQRGGWDRVERPTLTDAERERLSKRIHVDPSSKCWLWDGRPDVYGKTSWRGMPIQAHRLMMMLYSGEPVPWDAHVHHACETKGCVNPGHLRILTPQQHGALHTAGVGRRS